MQELSQLPTWEMHAKEKEQPDSLVKSLRGYNRPLNTVKSLQHGRTYERQAVKDWEKAFTILWW